MQENHTRFPPVPTLKQLCNVTVRSVAGEYPAAGSRIPVALSLTECYNTLMSLTREEKYMKEAIRQAHKAAAIGDVPIGCVIVQGDRIIARGYNRRTAKGNVLQHAEIIAIDRACRRTGDWRLEECEMYVTLEPCPMCAGAVVQARIPKVYIGAMNPKAGCAGSILDMFHESRFNHRVETVIGTCGEECISLMKDFFRDLREAHPKKVKYIPGEGRIERQ